MTSKLKTLFHTYRETIVYLIFGVATTAVNWIVCWLCNHLFALEITLSNAIAWVAGVVFAYITNKLWVFESRSWAPHIVLTETAAFVGARAFSGVFDIFGPTLLAAIGLNRPLFGIEAGWAKVVVMVIVIVLNYVFSKFFVFTDGNAHAAGKTARRVYAVLCILAAVAAVAGLIWLRPTV